MYRNVVTEVSRDRNGPDRNGTDWNGSNRNGQTESARLKSPVSTQAIMLWFLIQILRSVYKDALMFCTCYKVKAEWKQAKKLKKGIRRSKK